MRLRLAFGLLPLACALGLLAGAAGAGTGGAVAVGHDSPSWSPDGNRLVFVGFRSGRLGDIYTVDADGRGERRLTATAAHEDMPRYSPDGTKIAFVRAVGNEQATFHLFVMNADGSDQRQITRDGGANFAPTWSPDGRELAFVTSRHGPTAHTIYAIGVDGAGERRLALGREPAWSPDGTAIAFTNANASGAPRLFTMRPDGSEVRTLTDHPVLWHNEMRPAWSPDGRTIAFVTERHAPVGNGEIYLVDADGRNGRRLTQNRVPDDFPAWAPDGRRLALSRGLGLRPEVYVVPVQSGVARKLTGVNLRFVRLVRPAAPRAGRFFTVDLVVRPRVDRFADVACYALAGKTLLAVELGAVVNGRLRCVWRVPRASRGKKLQAFAAVRAGGTQVSRNVSGRVR